MDTGGLVSVKVNFPVAELKVCGSVFQITMETILVVHWTANRSLVDAAHWRVTLVAVTMALPIAGAGRTKTVKALVALAGGRPLSATTVVKVNALPASAGAGVQVITSLV